MAKKKVQGICCICEEYGKLSFEHVPPRAAFNDQTIYKANIEQILDKGPDFIPSYLKQEQMGSGGYTLCGSCNNAMGSWYANSYISFSYQAANLLRISSGNGSSIYYPFYIFPLRLIKQIVSMFCSINGPGFIRKNSELKRFLLNPESKYIDPRINIFAYITDSIRSRQSPPIVASSQKGIIKFSEIGFAPLGFIMTYDSFPPDDRLIDISHFARYDFNHFDIFYLKLTRLPLDLYLPGDFRTRDEIMKDYERNINDV